MWLNNGAALLGTNPHSIDAGTSVSSSFTWTMASADMAMRLSSSNGGSDSKTIQVLLQIGTTITLALNPTSIRVGGTVTASGKLTRADGGSASGQTTSVKKGTSVVATATTNSSGNFSVGFTAPSTVGTYSYKSYFAGAGPLASAESMTGLIEIGMEGITIPPWASVLAPLAVGVALITVIRRR